MKTMNICIMSRGKVTFSGKMDFHDTREFLQNTFPNLRQVYHTGQASCAASGKEPVNILLSIAR